MTVTMHRFPATKYTSIRRESEAGDSLAIVEDEREGGERVHDGHHAQVPRQAPEVQLPAFLPLSGVIHTSMSLKYEPSSEPLSGVPHHLQLDADRGIELCPPTFSSRTGAHSPLPAPPPVAFPPPLCPASHQPPLPPADTASLSFWERAMACSESSRCTLPIW